MICSRRDLAKLALGAPLAAAFAKAKINSKIDGVMIGSQTYSFRDLPTLDARIDAMKQIGLGYAELTVSDIAPKDREALKAWRGDHPAGEERAAPQKIR